MRDHRWTIRARGATLAVAALAVTACTSDDAALAPTPAPGSPDVRLALSSAEAPVGSRVAVAVDVSKRAGARLLGVQGFVRYDAARLRFVGQSPDAGTLAMLNEAEAEAGALRLLSVNPAGLPERTATLVFEVVAPGYAPSLAYELEEASTGDEAIHAARISPRAVVDRALAPREARHMTRADWVAFLAPSEAENDRIRNLAGQYLLNLRFGDANLSGSITAADVAYLAGVSVGTIVISDATNRDAVIAGNVFPFNTPGLGEPGDALRPGVEAAGASPGNITVSDVSNISLESVGTDRPIVGELIPGRGPLATARRIVSGSITAAQTWSRDTVYQLSGIVRVQNAALTIQPGTRIEGDSSQVSALFVERTGQIFADGTALQPIVFTCTAVTKYKGCWGGLYIAGNAPINTGTPTSPAIRGSAGGCLEAQGEGNAPLYGGCDAADNSGVLRYVRIEYGGFLLSANNELNNLTLSGVGRGTIVDYVQVHGGLDDGLELFGGTADVKHVVATANSDDSFDISFGWNGRAQFVIVQHDSLDSDKGIEADNTETAATYLASPRTTPQLYNFTLVGKQNPAGTAGPAANNSEAAMHLRRGTAPTLRNFAIIGWDRVLDLDDNDTCSGFGAAGGLSLRNGVVGLYNRLDDADGSDPLCGYASTAELAIFADAANAFETITDAAAAGLVMVRPFDVRAPDFRLRTSRTGATPPSDGFFDATATYLGAVPPVTPSTTNNIAWYMGWSRPWQSTTTP